MRNFPLRSFLLPFIALYLITGSGCTKIDTTTLGSDLIPAVDNVSTFADTLYPASSQFLFTDSTRLTATDNHLLGSISNDPVFGTTHSDLYLELKPTFFPYFFGSAKDTLDPALAPGVGFDSAVLCIQVRGIYGDSLAPQRFSAYLLNSNTGNFKDSSYRINFTPDQPVGQMIGQTTIVPASVKNYTYLPAPQGKKDSVNFQVRIPLSAAFLNALVANLDTSAAGGGIYRSDSLFKSVIKGFAIKTDRDPQSNALIYSDVTDGKTRLEVHFRRRNFNRIDTTYSSFYFSNGVNTTPSAHAINLIRDRSAAEMTVAPQSDALYLQVTPGTYALLDLPALSLLSNRIVHRAELTIEQVPSGNGAIDQIMSPPNYLYLDLADTPLSSNRYKTIFYDLNPGAFYDPNSPISFLPSGGIDFGYYGGFLRKRVDPQTGATVNYYTFNITRYVQKIITSREYNYTMRLSAPYNLAYNGFIYPYRNALCFGRIKVGSGNHPRYPLRLRIVYSKI